MARRKAVVDVAVAVAPSEKTMDELEYAALDSPDGSSIGTTKTWEEYTSKYGLDANRRVQFVDNPGLAAKDEQRGESALVKIGYERDFVLAGKAIFTLRSKKTGMRFTYRVSKGKPRQGDNRLAPYFVSLLTGPDNGASYQYLGMLVGENLTLIPTKATRIGTDAPSWKAFNWFWGFTERGQAAPGVEMFHEGRCGRCGRALTVPESIETGLGPECATRMGR